VSYTGCYDDIQGVLCHIQGVVKVLLDVADVQQVRRCFQAVLGVRTLTSVLRVRRCVTTAPVETLTMVTLVIVMLGTLVRRVVNDAALCRS